MKKLIALGVIIVFTLTFNLKLSEARPKMQTIQYAVNLNWCGHIKRKCKAGKQALEVVRCETGSTFNVWAGFPRKEYWGLFQMGASERKIYGHGWNPWVQAKSAHRYWKIAGWSPWPYCGRLYY